MNKVKLTLIITPQDLLHMIEDLLDCPENYQITRGDKKFVLKINQAEDLRSLASAQIQHFLQQKLSQPARQEWINANLFWGKKHNLMKENNINTFAYDKK